MSRKPIIAGNWKMNLCRSEAKEVFEGIKNFVKDYTAQELPTVVIAPVVTKFLSLVKTATGKNQVLILVKFLLKC